MTEATKKDIPKTEKNSLWCVRLKVYIILLCLLFLVVFYTKIIHKEQKWSFDTCFLIQIAFASFFLILVT